MIDIYKQKAKKYKYKYLKLKRQYIGGGENNDFKFIGSGNYGCIISPPLQFNTLNEDNILYPLEKIISDDIYNDKKYIGKFLSCYMNSFQNEMNEFIELDKIDPEAKHRSKIIFAAYYNKKKLTKRLKQNINYFFSLKNYNTLYKCLYEKKLLKKIDDQENLTNANSNDNYGYIISTKVGTSFDKIELNKFKLGQIIIILTNLKESIEDLIVKLYDKKMIHGDLKFQNMTLDGSFKISFIDFGLMNNNSEIIKIANNSVNHQYSDIIFIFMKIINNLSPFFNNINKMTSLDLITKITLIKMKFTKKKFIEMLNDRKYAKNGTILPKLLKSLNSIKAIQSSVSIKPIDYINFFKSLEDDKEYPLIDFYNECIVPIIKNIDIYALSLFIYQLFFTILGLNILGFNIISFKTFNSNFIKKDTRNILYALLNNALYNNIDGPTELIIYLDGIINSLKDDDSYKPGTITSKIEILRKTKVKN